MNNLKTKTLKNLKIVLNPPLISKENFKEKNITLSNKKEKGKNKINHYYSSKEKKVKNNQKKRISNGQN